MSLYPKQTFCFYVRNMKIDCLGLGKAKYEICHLRSRSSFRSPAGLTYWYQTSTYDDSVSFRRCLQCLKNTCQSNTGPQKHTEYRNLGEWERCRECFRGAASGSPGVPALLPPAREGLRRTRSRLAPLF